MTLRLDWAGNVRQSRDVAGRGWKRVADLVVAARLKHGYDTQPAFAAASGVSPRTIGTLERGNPVSPRTLRAVETKLGMSPGYLDDVRDEDTNAPASQQPSTSPPELALVPPADTPARSPGTPRADLLQERLREPLVDEAGEPIRDRYGDTVTPARLFSFLEHVLMYSNDGTAAFQRALRTAAAQYGLEMEDRN